LFDDEFVKKYLYYLNEYSKEDFLANFLEGLEESIVSRELFIRKRHGNYKFDREFIKKKATKIQIALPAHVNSLQVFTQKKGESTTKLKLVNQHNFPIEIITGASINERSIVYPQIRKSVPQYFDWEVPIGTKTIEYRVPGLDSIYKTSISKWSIQKNEAPRQELQATDLSRISDNVEISDRLLTFKPGVVNIYEPFIIPSGGELRINAGTQINLSGQGFILSYSPVQIVGDPDEPIIFNCEDGKNGSFTVMQADGRSRLRNVIFKNQNTLNYNKWQLTGAVNFYESDVDITRTSFENNQCEDALNIIRSEFHMEESSFKGTYADAFDSDFCTGKVLNSTFIDTGNDAIDASRSFLRIEGTKIINAGDKGISAGEQSTIHTDWNRIENAVIGMASKDRSKLFANNLTIENCNTGFAAFQKKPEFGPAIIFLELVHSKNIKHMYMKEDGSVIKTQKESE